MRTNKSTHKILVAAFLLLIIIPARAQVIPPTYPLPSHSQLVTLAGNYNQVITREWADRYVVYTAPQPTLSILNQDAPTGNSVSLELPAHVSVVDMQVQNDTLFLVGNEADTCGFLAYINLQSMLTGNNVLNVVRFPYALYDNSGSSSYFYAKIAMMRKLEVSQNIQGHIFLLGQAYGKIVTMRIQDTTYRYDTISCFADYNLHTNTITFLWNKHYEETFFDVVCTDRYLVSLSMNQSFKPSYARVFPAYQLNIGSVCKDYAMRIDNGYKEIKEMLGEPMDDDCFAVAVLGEDSLLGNQVVDINQYRVFGDSQYPGGYGISRERRISYSNSISGLNGFAHNKRCGAFYLLLQVGNTDGVLETEGVRSSLVLYQYPFDLLSIHANHSTGHRAFVGCGLNSGNAGITWENQQFGSECVRSFGTSVTEPDPEQNIPYLNIILDDHRMRATITSWLCTSHNIYYKQECSE